MTRDNDRRDSVSLSALSLLPIEPPDAVRIARDSGFGMMGLRLTPSSSGVDFGMLTDPRMVARTVSSLAEHGVTVLDAEVVWIRPGSRSDDFVPLLDVAAALGARHVLAVVDDPEENRGRAVLASLAREASVRNMQVMVEFMVFTHTPDLESALRLVDTPELSGVGILVDSLHLCRSGASVEDLTAVDPSRLPYFQICDAAHGEPESDSVAARAEAISARLLPGDGVLDLAGMVDALPPRAVVSVEVPCTETDREKATEFARRALEQTTRVMRNRNGQNS